MTGKAKALNWKCRRCDGRLRVFVQVENAETHIRIVYFKCEKCAVVEIVEQ